MEDVTTCDPEISNFQSILTFWIAILPIYNVKGVHDIVKISEDDMDS